MNTIIVKLKGGLGNQLFQFALGKSLALKSNSTLLLDKSLFEHYELHAFSLSPFNIHDGFADKRQIPDQYLYNNKLMRKSFEFIDTLIYRNKIIKEETLNFNKDKFNLDFTGKIYMDGYWQSEKYFNDYKAEIRTALTLKNVITDERTIKLQDEINSSNAVSIHIRRGNYALAETQKIHGLATVDFYDKAISFFKNKIKEPKFFIFSDDYDYVSEKFKELDNSIIVKSSVDKDYLDLHLMSLCKHNIIANSSFSWWSAWLNSNAEKIVIAPGRWYNDDTLNNQTKDLIPDSWLRF